MTVYHILETESWENAKKQGFYVPSSLTKEGFIHCSTAEQVLPIANRRFVGKSDLLLLVIDSEKVGSKIAFEDTSGRGEDHPHIYGKLPLVAVEKALQLKPDETGHFVNVPI